MESGILGLLGKTVALMENLGFLWLVYSGFELRLWEELQEKKTLPALLGAHPEWDPVLLEHWLTQAVVHNLLVHDQETYRLAKSGKSLLRFRDLGLEALYKELVLYWGPCFSQLPGLIAGESERRDLDNALKDELVSRAARSSEIFVWPVLRSRCAKENWRKVLDVGCGEGVYLKKLLTVFPGLSGVGLEINPSTCARAQEGRGKFQERLQFVCADIFDFFAQEAFDCCLLHNSIYYFSGEKRLELLRHLKKMLKPGGRIGILTALRGLTSSVPVLRTHVPQNLMSFFLACHQGFSGLPAEGEIGELLAAAGFEKIETTPLLFKVSHYFFASKPEEK
ncbi:MAG TPA: class I SAM-dependent methyltransferase [Desulfitobacteriaceae bacterium]|nr:class I SAM-dependent methyltransferase [Desulfitobacteriaceae bacterium]